jgi:hypothetical protein
VGNTEWGREKNKGGSYEPIRKGRRKMISRKENK